MTDEGVDVRVDDAMAYEGQRGGKQELEDTRSLTMKLCLYLESLFAAIAIGGVDRIDS